MNLIAPLPPISEPEGEDDSSSPPAVEDVEVQAMADRIVHYAQKCMFNKQRQSPFERAAAREGLFYRGGVSSICICGECALMSACDVENRNRMSKYRPCTRPRFVDARTDQ